MKYLILIFILTFSVSCKTKSISEKATEKSELKPPFNNQGEQENYWTQELFKKEYEKKVYPKYYGKIKQTENKIYFGIQMVEFMNSNLKYQLIFENGLLYPEIINQQTLKVSNLEELKFLSKNPKIKRFRFWLFQNNRMNPQVYVFELINENADTETDWKSFIKNAKLTFIKSGWIII